MARYIKRRGHLSALYRRCVFQMHLINKNFPCFSCNLRGNRHLYCIGNVTPYEGGNTYRITIDYTPPLAPRVRILKPSIDPKHEIHMYRSGDLCLFDPRESPWKSHYNISDKTIPWIAEWLIFYELFLLTGEWKGSSTTHGPN